MKKLLTLAPCIIAVSIFPASAISAVVSKGLPHETAQKEGQQRRKAIVKFKPEPSYPKEARGIRATIVLRAIFRASGKVTDIKFDKVIPGNLPEDIVEAFTKECVKAAGKIRFEPAMKDGHPVSMYIQLEYNFLPD